MRLGLSKPGQRLQGLVTLSADERERFRAAQAALSERERDAHLFEILEGNMAEFAGLLEGVTEALRENRISHADLRLIHRETDRRLLNVLTAMRTFLDHWETNLKRRYGKTSRQEMSDSTLFQSWFG